MPAPPCSLYQCIYVVRSSSPPSKIHCYSNLISYLPVGLLALGCDGVDLVDENDGWGILLCFLEGLAQVALRLTRHLLRRDGEEINTPREIKEQAKKLLLLPPLILSQLHPALW